MHIIRRCVCSALVIVLEVIFDGASESGTGGCVILVLNALVCMECTGGTSVSGRAVVIYGSEVMEEATDHCCRNLGDHEGIH